MRFKIKFYLLVALVSLCYSNSKAQLININPDPNGDPWWIVGLPEITPEIQADLDAIPELVLSSTSSSTALPSKVDNSQHIFFRPIFDQSGQSCGQASGVSYCFTYEINRLRNISSNIAENQYPSHYTWTMLNAGLGSQGSWYFDGWQIIKENGCPNEPTYVTVPSNWRKWMTGYEKYDSAMHNRIDKYWYIKVSSPSGLEDFKHWLNDHNSGDETGGLGCFTMHTGGNTYATLPPESDDAGKSLIKDWNYSENGYHSMTFVGFNDSIKFDINNDGLYTNDIDTNDDGVIDMLDWEIGALKVANSVIEWPTPADSGFAYLPYRLLPKEDYNPQDTTISLDAITGKVIHVLEALADYEPLLCVKVSVDYPKRNKLQFQVGYSNNSNQTNPTEQTEYSSFNYQGGPFDMIYPSTDPIEVGLDFGYWYKNEDFGKIFFIIDEDDSLNLSSGIVEYFSFIDKRWDEEFEVICDETNVTIINDAATILSINYDLIPHENYISNNLTLDSDMICRFNPTVQGALLGATLTIDEGVQIDMYESELKISSNSTLSIDDSVTIVAKEGTCKITVDGSISVGSGVIFKAEPGAKLEIYFNKTSQTLTIDDVKFEGTELYSYVADLTIKNCTITDGFIKAYYGDIEIDNAEFNDSYATCANADYSNSKVTVTGGCNFTDESSTFALKIDDYPEFLVENSSFIDNLYGINILYSGDGRSNGEITGNTITGCAQTAIQVYYSDIDISENTIHSNGYGIKSLNGSTTGLDGGNTSTPAQYIKDNTYNEVYASSGAFPHHFSWNGIIDNDNTDPLVKYGGSSGTLYVINNYWGGSYFDPSTDLDPPSLFVYSPIWDPSNKSTDVAESLYDGALQKIDQENYSGGKEDLKELIEEYSTTIYAQTAVKKLFSMEEYAGADYMSLKTYLSDEESLEDGAELEKIRDFLVTFCEIKLENWETAITWFENIIMDPETMEDSIFSIIDLGYTYLLMEEGGYKSTYIGALQQHIPESREAYEEESEYLLRLIPGNEMSEEMQKDIQQLENGELLHNVPNPFSSSTQLWYKLDAESEIMIRVFDYTGKEVKIYPVGTQSQGHHHVDFSSDNLPSGIYFYNLEVNGTVTDTKKMTLIK